MSVRAASNEERALVYLVAALDMATDDPGRRETVREARDRARSVLAAAPSRPASADLLALMADLVSFRVTNDAGECSWCEADNPARTTDHRPSCPWRRAQEIVHASR